MEYSKEENEMFDAYLDDVSKSNWFSHISTIERLPNKFSVDVFWTHNEEGNIVLGVDEMRLQFRKRLMDYQNQVATRNRKVA
jgi:hypothetical protein